MADWLGIQDLRRDNMMGSLIFFSSSIYPWTGHWRDLQPDTVKDIIIITIIIFYYYYCYKARRAYSLNLKEGELGSPTETLQRAPPSIL